MRMVFALGLFAVTPFVQAADVGDALARIKAVKREGAGNEAAAVAWRELVKAGPEALPKILTAFDDTDPVSANWLRSVVDAICETERTANRPLPVNIFEAVLSDRKQPGLARRIAFEWFTAADPKARERLLPTMLDDPTGELRREAVAFAIERLEKATPTADGYKAIFSYARDVDQVEALAKKLKDLGVVVDLNEHYGFITAWRIAGPLENTKTAFASDQPMTACRESSGLTWKPYATTHRTGMVDLYTVTGKAKGVDKGTKKKDAVYALALAEIESPATRPVQIRVGSPNAVRVVLNGEQIFAREEYHHGSQIDQHIARGTLKAGANRLLIAVYQNDQTEEWTLAWQFQLRVCDDIGGAVPLKVLAPSKEPK